MREIYKIYAATFLVGVAGSVSVISTLFYLANGLNQTQLATLFSIFFITYAILEIPTGGIADTFGHKKSIFLGLLFQSLGMLTVTLGTNFYVFILAMLFAGLGLALISGAYSFLVHDLLERINKSDQFTKVYARTGMYMLLGPLIASPIVSFIYKMNPRAPYLLAFIIMLFSAFLIYLVKWEFRGDKPSFKIYFTKMRNGLILTLKSKRLVALILISIGLGLSRSLFSQNINQPFLLTIGFDVAVLGTIAAIVSGADALTSSVSHKIFDTLKSIPSLLIIVVVSAISTIILSQTHVLYGVIFVILFFAVHTYRENIVMTLSNQEATNGERSTIISTTSFVTYIIIGALMPLGGYSIDAFGIRNTLIIISILTLILGLIGIFIYKLSNE